MRVAIRLLAVAVALISACHEQDEDEGFDADKDSATLRKAAMYEWYNDHKSTTPSSSYWSRDYMKYVMRVAGDEQARWRNLLPRLGVSQLVTGDQWINIGPTKADVA